MSNTAIIQVQVSHPSTTPTPLREMVERVLDNCDVKASTKTVYRYGLTDFINWNPEGLLDAGVVVRYKGQLRSRADLSTSTKNLYLTGVRIFFRTLFDLGVLPRDFGKVAKGFKINRGHKKHPITDQEVETVFAFVRKSPDKRLLPLLTLLHFQGLRQNEVLGVRVEDFNPSTKTLSILGKGKDEHESIDLHPETVKVLSAYLAETKEKSGYLFWSRKNPTEHLSRQQLNNILRGIHASCGVKNVGHAWRKVFVSKLIDSGMDLLTVSSFSRHQSIEMLKVYYDRLDRKRKLPAYYQAFGEIGSL